MGILVDMLRYLFSTFLSPISMFWPNFIFLEHNDLITFFTIFKKIERKYFVCYEYFKEK